MTATIGDAMILSSLFGLLIFIVFMLFLSGVIDRIHTRSKRYREFLADMYVSAKIRKIANSEDINLEDEAKSFFKNQKYLDRPTKSFDRIVEDELMEKVQSTEEVR